MSEEKMDWEKAENRFREGYKNFDASIITSVTFVVALLLWMFITLVVGTGIIMGIVWFVILGILALIANAILQKMLL